MKSKTIQTSIRKLHSEVWTYYQSNGRHSLPWRKTKDPYKILVSELMLQQTQVSRVLPKYKEFLNIFPTIQDLAKARLADVLRAWQGLGYNRRAKFLHMLAQQVQAEHKDKLPTDESKLLALPGIGKATAAAIIAFAYNKPSVYLETNVRSVFLYHFFSKSDNSKGNPFAAKGLPFGDSVADSELLPLIQLAAQGQSPREWNWALLDYGAYLKTIHPNPSRKSKHHTLQSKFQGSDRQIRGQVLRYLSNKPHTMSELLRLLNVPETRGKKIIKDLLKEGLVTQKRNGLYLG